MRTVEQLKSVFADRRLHLRFYPTGKAELWVDDRSVVKIDLLVANEREEENFRNVFIASVGLTEDEYDIVENFFVSPSIGM